MGWSIHEVRGAETSPDRDTVDAAVVVLRRDGAERRVLVELAGTARAAGVRLEPRYAIRQFLKDDEPPKRLVINTDRVLVSDPRPE